MKIILINATKVSLSYVINMYIKSFCFEMAEFDFLCKLLEIFVIIFESQSLA